MSRSKWFFFIATITITGFFVVIVVSEILLRYKKYNIESSDHIDDGVIAYDKHPSWKLTPNWKG